ncbi:hypothetical protein BJ944DRAFT_260527 [Cunninghamella echinulata]|nr:hypothetical protein BJ944DRAFT_260527 [Cunninghamella echinulata]
MAPEHKRISNEDLPDLKRYAYGINDIPSRLFNTSIKPSISSTSQNNNNSNNNNHSKTISSIKHNNTITNTNTNNINQDGCFETLIPSFRRLNNAFTTMKDQYKELQEVDKSLSKFNDSFGAFLLGMSVNGTAIDWLKAPNEEALEKYKGHLKKEDKNKPSISTIDDSNHKNKQKTANPNTKQADAPTVNRKNKFANKVNIQKIIDHLPLKYREQTEHMNNMKIILKILRSSPEGMNMATMVKVSNLPKYRVTDCLNALVHSKHVVKYNPQGQLANYKLNIFF